MKRLIKDTCMAVAAISCVLAFPVLAQAAPPPNDNFASAQVIGPALPLSVPGTNVEATAQGGEPNVAGNMPISTVWYRWTAPANQTVVYDLCNDDFSGPEGSFTTMEIYTGATLGTLVSVAEGSVADCFVRFNATAGQEYKIQLDYRSNQGTFNVKLRQLAPPSNDNFAAALAIGPALPVSVAATNVDATWQAGEPPALGNSASSSRSVWFGWTAPSNGQVRATACDFSRNTISGAGNLTLAVYTGATIGTLVALTPNNGNCEQTFTAVGGTTYRIAFSGNVRGEGNFTLGLKSAPPPANDDFANATTVGPALPVNVVADNEFAGVQAGEPDHGGLDPHRSVWYQWTPVESARVVIRSCSKDFTARVGVYTGLAVNALTTEGEEPGFAPYCRIPLDAVAGTTYRIAVSGGQQDGEYGKTNLQIRTERVPANDDFDRAQKLLLKSDGQVTGSTVDSSTEPSEPGHEPGSYSGSGGSVWYRWTAGSSQPIVLSACSKTEPVILAVYAGSGYDALTQVAASNSGCPTGSSGGKLALAPTKGTTYRIAVASKERDFDAAFTLSSRGPYLTARKYNLKKQLKSCRKIGKKSKRKRCERNAREKNAVLKCQNKLDATQQAECVKAARKKY